MAMAAGLFGHELVFLDHARRSNPSSWTVCRSCRISCFVDLRTPETTDKSIERWMLKTCDAETRTEELMHFQIILQPDGIKAIFSAEPVTGALLKRLRSFTSIGPEIAHRGALTNDDRKRIHRRGYLRRGRR